MKKPRLFIHLLTNLSFLMPKFDRMIIPCVSLDSNTNQLKMKRYKLKSLMAILFFLLTVPGFMEGQVDIRKFTVGVEQQQLNIQEVLSRYLQIPSVSGQEKEAGEFLKRICEENNLYITQMGDQDGNYNFAASIMPLSSKLPNIIFLNHIDVVSEGDTANWTYPPYSGMIVDGDIWGRGAFDNKGPAIMQLFSVIAAAKKYQNYDFPYNVTLLAVSCEENSCDGGIRYVLDNYLEILNPEVVIGEGPPSINGVLRSDPEHAIFCISVAHKRPLWLQLDLEVESSGHGSVTPPTYANVEMVTAMNRLMKKKRKVIFNEINVGMLKDLGKMEKGITAFALKNPRLFKGLLMPQLRKQPELFALFTNTITLTSLDSDNDVHNVIPHKIRALLDCRLLPDQSADDFLQNVKNKLKNEAIEITIVNKCPEMKPSSRTNKFYLHYEEAIKAHFPDNKTMAIMLPSGNDNGSFRTKGITAYGSIPVLIDREYLTYIHNYNERIPVSTLDQGQAVYTDFVVRCMSEGELQQILTVNYVGKSLEIEGPKI